MASPLRAPLVTHIHFLPTPVMAGVRAAKANLIPGLTVQCLMALVVALYYLYKPFHGVLQQVAAVKAHCGELHLRRSAQ